MAWAKGFAGRLDAAVQRPAVFGGLLCALGLLRFLLSFGMQLYFIPDTGFDDVMQIGKAMSLAGGHWLGEYGPLTLVKGAGYPLLAALFSRLGLPYIQAWHLLYIGACLVFLHAVSPLATRRWQLLVCYGITLFCPIAFATQITRLYRDVGYYALAFLCVACGLGLLLHRRALPSLAYAVGGGATLGLCMLYREDSQWLLIYVVCCALARLVFFFVEGPRRRIVRQAALLAAGAAAVGGVLLPVAAANERWYGAFRLDEYNTGPYAAAYGALSRFDGGQENPGVTIDGQMRAYLYENSPAFALLEPVLDGEGAVLALWKEVQGEYRTGYFSFVLRQAAAQIGMYESSEVADAFFRQLALEANALADEGAVPAGPRRSGVAPRFYPWMLRPVAGASLEGLWATLRCSEIDPLPRPVEADDGYLRHFEDFVHADIAAWRYMEETGEVVENFHLSGPRLWMQRACRVVVAVWRIVLAPLFLLALAGFCALLVCMLARRRGTAQVWRQAVAVLSLLCALLLRCAMLGFVHVGAFSAIYTPSYQAATYPLITGFIAAVFLLACRCLPRRQGAAPREEEESRKTG